MPSARGRPRQSGELASTPSTAGPSAGPSSPAPGSARKAKGAAPTAPAHTQAIPEAPPSPIVKRLRQTWQFAAVCQFLFTFDEAFGMSGFESMAFERDFDGTETAVIPDLMVRMLYTLTLDKHIDLTNWQEHLRRQYLARAPEENKLGTLEEPVDWAALSLTDKVLALHALCEWQLQDPERFRKLVKSEDECLAWRIEPVGWDAHDNTYWLFDDNRLWIQRPPPPPPVTPKKRAPPKKGSKRARVEAAAARRQAAAAKAVSVGGTPASTRGRRSAGAPESPLPASAKGKTPANGRIVPAKRGRTSEGSISTPTATPSKRTRSSFNAPASASRPSTPASASRPTRSTRTSSRLKQDDDGWQQIPAEWLNAEGEERNCGPSTPHGKNGANDEDMFDDNSDLSDPPEDEGNGDDAAANGRAEDDAMDVDEAEDVAAANGNANGSSGIVQDDFVEFETICVSRYEWETFVQSLAKSKHPDEKALYQLLSETVLPKVLADLAEAERQRQLEIALQNRKRSSRIALKESEREDRERDRIAKAAMEERMEAMRREEREKAIREEKEAEAQRAREERLREREERLLAREREIMERAQREEEERVRREKDREARARKRDEIIANGGVPPRSETPEQKMATPVPQPEEDDDDNWVLRCEVCGKSGVNLQETAEIVSCESCGVWQHTECWNARDRSMGRKPRDWDAEDFYCSKCSTEPAAPRTTLSAPSLPARAAPASSGVQPSAAAATSPKETAASAGGMATRPGPIILPPAGLPSAAPVPASSAQRPTTGTPMIPTSNGTGGAVAPQASVPVRPPLTPGRAPPGPNHASPQTSPGLPRVPPSPTLVNGGSPKYGNSGSYPRTQQSSGSFPIRHLTARSPLSGPHEFTGSQLPPALSLGPPRAQSPSPSPQAPAQLQRGAATGPFGSPHSTVHSGQIGASAPIQPRSIPPTTGSVLASPKPGTNLAQAASMKLGAGAGAGASGTNLAPGLSSPRAHADPAKQFGPSPPRQPFGSPVSTPRSAPRPGSGSGPAPSSPLSASAISATSSSVNANESSAQARPADSGRAQMMPPPSRPAGTPGVGASASASAATQPLSGVEPSAAPAPVPTAQPISATPVSTPTTLPNAPAPTPVSATPTSMSVPVAASPAAQAVSTASAASGSQSALPVAHAQQSMPAPAQSQQQQ